MALLKVVDFETGGLDATDKVIESGWAFFETATGAITPGGSALHFAADIKPDAMAAHHIWPADIEGKPPFDAEDFVKTAIDEGCAGLVCHNAEFEAQWIGRICEGVLPIVCTYKAALRKFPDAPSHGNFALAYWLMQQGKIDLEPVRATTEPAHRAGPDAYVTAFILAALYADGVTGKDLARWTREPKLFPKCTIGEHRGKPWGDVPGGFLSWMVKTETMEADLKWNAQRELDRRR